MPNDVIVLRHYRINRRPQIKLSAGLASLRLPIQFGGKRRWEIPISSLAARALSKEDVRAFRRATVESNVTPTPVVPYFPTTGPGPVPTLMLLFKQPQRVPPFSFGMALKNSASAYVTYTESRSAEGRMLDGVLLRAVDSHQALNALHAIGVESIEDPIAWLEAHRRVEVDPTRIERAADIRRSANRRSGVGAALAVVAVVLLHVLSDGGTGWVGRRWPVVLGAIVVVSVAFALVDRSARKRRREADQQ